MTSLYEAQVFDDLIQTLISDLNISLFKDLHMLHVETRLEVHHSWQIVQVALRVRGH